MSEERKIVFKHGGVMRLNPTGGTVGLTEPNTDFSPESIISTELTRAMPFRKQRDEATKNLPPSRFEYELIDGKHYVTERKSGLYAEIYKDDNNWRARNFQNVKESDKGRLVTLGQAMANWFYYHIIQGK